MVQNWKVESGSKVVRVGDKHVLVSSGEQGVEASRTDESRVKIAVTGRAPFVGRIRLAGGRLKSIENKNK